MMHYLQVSRETTALLEALERYKSGAAPLETLSLEQISGMKEAVRRMNAEVAGKWVNECTRKSYQY